METTVDYGPLAHLIGAWKGNKGVDLAPHPDDGRETNPFYETITFEALAPTLFNAKKQEISPIFYHQRIYRKSNDEEFHNQCGYWMWIPEEKLVMHTLTIPRGMAVVAGGYYNGEIDSNGNIVISLEAGLDNKDWPIAQSPFLRDNASTISFTFKGTIGPDSYKYSEVTILDIYDNKEFKHIDNSTLTRQ